MTAATPSELEEMVARAICAEWHWQWDLLDTEGRDMCIRYAKAALAVVREALAEPTPEMILAGHRQIDWCRDSQNTYLPEHPSQHPEGVGSSCGEDVADAFRAMLAASPLRAGS